MANWDAAEYVEKLIDGGELRKNAIVDAGKRFGLSRSAVEAAISSRKAARDEHDTLGREWAADQEP